MITRATRTVYTALHRLCGEDGGVEGGAEGDGDVVTAYGCEKTGVGGF